MTRTAEHRSSPRVLRMTERLASVVLFALLAFGVALQARAQAEPDVDPPDRAARLSEVVGQVWLYSPDSDEWLGVARNRPLTTGDRIATDNDARAEITLGSTTLRLDAATELEIVLLDDERFSLHLHRGSVAARLRSAQAVPEFAMNTDEGRFRLQAAGRYRFDRFEQASDITVMSGQAVFEGRNSALTVQSGQHAQFWLDAGGAPQYRMVQSMRDAFATWNDDRDSAEDRVVASRYVSPEMTGAGDLDRYGRWEQTTDYGPVWHPTVVPSGWAPYSTGHWAWIRPWGWTWVDDAPWGFAPFHYGRWVYYRNVWGWAPGTYVRRPVYAPALVAWMGGSRGSVSISIGGGPAVGWFPLAPREVYVPYYRASSRYVRNINFTHVDNVSVIDNHWRNRHGDGDRRDFSNRKFPHAVTVVPQSVLTGRQPVAPVAGRFRNDPQVRAMVSDGRSLGVSTAAPVAMPQVGTRRAEGRPPRPPFEGRAPGSIAGRPDAGRVEGDRPDARDARDGQGERRGERAAERPGERVGERAWERRGERIGERPSERPGERVGERAWDRPGDRTGERRDRPGDRVGERPALGVPSPMAPAAPLVTAPVRPAPGATDGAPSVPPPRAGREPALNDAPGRGNAAPWQRGAQIDEAGRRPGFPGRERRGEFDGSAGEGRPAAGPRGGGMAPAAPRGIEAPRAAELPRPAEPPRALERPAPAPRAAEVQRPSPAPRAVEVQRPAALPAPAAPAAPPVAREAREPRMGRPESPRERDEGRPERRGPPERVR